MSKKFCFLLVCLTLNFLCLKAQTTTITSNGNWDDTGIWQSGEIGDDISEDVVFNNEIGKVTVRNGFTYTIGEVNMNDENELEVASGGVLNVGSSSDNKNFSTNNETYITIHGTLEIWGDLIINNELVLEVTGTLIVHGDIIIGNEASLDISGDATIGGDFIGGDETALNVDGTLDIGGNISVGNDSTITGSGTMTYGGTCSDGNSDFCGVGPLPVKLVYFRGNRVENSVLLSWQTATELNNDFFTIERSQNGIVFEPLGFITGAGSTNEPQYYEYVDENPYPGLSYYRLRQTDFDGTTETFRPVSVSFESERPVAAVYPNPFRGKELNLSITGLSSNSKVQMKILDIKGYTVFEKNLDSGSSTNYHERFDVDFLSSGYYIVSLSSDKISSGIKFIME